MRLGILATHPIQYQAPWFRHLAQRFDLEVFFAHQQDAAGQAAAGFDVAFEWDVPLLEGYYYRWLRNVARSPGVSRFTGCDTPELATLIADGSFDAFLVFGWNKKCYLQALWACWRQGVPVLIRGDSQLPTPRPRWKTAAKYLPYRWLLGRIDAHLYVGQRNHDYLRHYGVAEERLFFCPHFVDNEFFAERARRAATEGSRARIRDGLGIPPDALVFVFVGKLIPRKRPHDFLKAFQQAREAAGGREWFAVLVGDGPLKESLQQGASCNVRFAGFRNQSELPAYYHAADTVVLPSDATETWGLIVNEAMACGRPALVSDAVGCTPDLIDHASTGFTFPLGDTAALAKCMFAMREVVAQRPKELQASLAAKLQMYSPETATAGLSEALDSICRRRERRAKPVGKPSALSTAEV